jgi:hypothetical protein
MKFLVDECLSTDLVTLARERGHYESSHVLWIGKGGMKDWNLIRLIIDENWTLVTKNSYDFRGPRDAPGTKGQYAKVELHEGLVCLNASDGMDLDLQVDLFAHALEDLERDGELINMVLEVLFDAEGGSVSIDRYPLPS